MFGGRSFSKNATSPRVVAASALAKRLKIAVFSPQTACLKAAVSRRRRILAKRVFQTVTFVTFWEFFPKILKIFAKTLIFKHVKN
jgi:hypothetical protein